MELQLADAAFVAILAPLRSRVVFESADLVARSAEGLVRVRRYGPTTVEGPELSTDLVTLARADEAMELEAIPAVEGAVGWVLRHGDELLVELENGLRSQPGALLAGPISVGPEVRCFVVHQLAATAVRGTMADRALALAKRHLAARSSQTLRYAELAFELAVSKTAETYGVLAAAYRVSGDVANAEGMLAVASKRGFGDEARQVATGAWVRRALAQELRSARLPSPREQAA